MEPQFNMTGCGKTRLLSDILEKDYKNHDVLDV